MSTPVAGALAGALAGQLPAPVPTDALAGSVPPIPVPATEQAALTLERTVSITVANQMRRHWHTLHGGAPTRPPTNPASGPTTQLYDPCCPYCEGTGLVPNRTQPVHTTYVPCTCGDTARRQAAQRVVAQDSLLAQYPRATFALLDDRPYQRTAVDAALRFLEDLDRGIPSWLTLLGDTSGGKTFLAAVIGNAVLQRNQMSVLMQNAPALLEHLRAAFNPNVGGQYDALFEKIKTVDVLILDDLGSQKQTDWAAEKMYHLLEERTVYARPTVVTTNEPLSNLGNAIAGRLAFREHRRLCVLETGRAGKPLTGLYMFQHDAVICQRCGCRPCWDECPAPIYPDVDAAPSRNVGEAGT